MEAASSAFVVWLLGGVALGIAASFAGDMIPSPPPFLGGGAEAGTGRSWFAGHWLHSVKWYGFAFLFSVFFAHSLWIGFRGRGYRRADAGVAGRVGFILTKIREDWFGLIVGNAIGAWVGAVLLAYASGFSLPHIIWDLCMEPVSSIAQGLGVSIFGRGGSSTIKEWFAWYGANQMKLNFWFLYLAGVCDDLGLPNFKALGRWLWRGWRKRNAVGSATEASGNQSAPILVRDAGKRTAE